MKRVLIGVLFVVALLGAGVVGMVFGRFTQPADVPLAATTSSALDATSPTAILLVLPTVAAVTPVRVNPTIESTTQSLVTTMMSGVVPTSGPDCRVETANLSSGNTFTVSFDTPSTLWYAIDTEKDSPLTMNGPVIAGKIRVYGIDYDNYMLLSYSLRSHMTDNFPVNSEPYSISGGQYTVVANPIFSDYHLDTPMVYQIYICPPVN